MIKIEDIKKELQKEKENALSLKLKEKLKERLEKKSLPKLAKLNDFNELECILCKFITKDDKIFIKHYTNEKHLKSVNEYMEKKTKKNVVVVGEKRKSEISYEITENVVGVEENIKNQENNDLEEKEENDNLIQNQQNIEKSPENIEKNKNIPSFLPKNFFDDKEKHIEIYNNLKNNDKIEIEDNLNENVENIEEKFQQINDQNDEFLKKTLERDENEDILMDLRLKLKNKKNEKKQSGIDKIIVNKLPEENTQDININNYNWKKKRIF